MERSTLALLSSATLGFPALHTVGVVAKEPRDWNGRGSTVAVSQLEKTGWDGSVFRGSYLFQLAILANSCTHSCNYRVIHTTFQVSPGLLVMMSTEISQAMERQTNEHSQASPAGWVRCPVAGG